MIEKCGQRQLSAGSYPLYIEGFQAGGGVGMEAKYSGPDTRGQKVFMRSGLPASLNKAAGRYYARCNPSQKGTPLQFTMCMFRSEVYLGRIPEIGLADTGANRLYFAGRGDIPVVDMHSLADFRIPVPATPEVNYAWAIYGRLLIGTAGRYSLCIISDDG